MTAAAAHAEALRIYRRIGDRRGEALTIAQLSLTRAYDVPEEAVVLGEQAVAILREVGDRSGEGQWLAKLGALYHRAGRDDEAHRCWSQALARLDPAGPDHRRLAARLTAAN